MLLAYEEWAKYLCGTIVDVYLNMIQTRSDNYKKLDCCNPGSSLSGMT